jgi:N-acetylglucosaminyldiphosphoundecaprenol N-acetyl-beta-D-mannosaminyltransferase
MIFDTLIKTGDAVLDLVSRRAKTNKNILITYLNQNCFNVYKYNPGYAKITENVFHVYLDGAGIYIALVLLGCKNLKMINATDLNEKILNLLISQRKKIFIVGGNFSEALISEAVKKGINICGYQNGYFDKEMEVHVIRKIEVANPEVIFIGMGVPKQEFFAVRLSSNVKGKLIICTGNFFEFYFQNIRRIPKRLRNIGVEWLFRLITEPKRLWKRYIFGIPLFSLYVFKEMFRRKKGRIVSN